MKPYEPRFFIQHAARVAGPFHSVSCYGPDNEIGKTGRRIVSHLNTQKNMMVNFVTMKICERTLGDYVQRKETIEARVLNVCRKLLEECQAEYLNQSIGGTCRT